MQTVMFWDFWKHLQCQVATRSQRLSFSDKPFYQWPTAGQVLSQKGFHLILSPKSSLLSHPQGQLLSFKSSWVSAFKFSNSLWPGFPALSTQKLEWPCRCINLIKSVSCLRTSLSPGSRGRVCSWAWHSRPCVIAPGPPHRYPAAGVALPHSPLWEKPQEPPFSMAAGQSWLVLCELQHLDFSLKASLAAPITNGLPYPWAGPGALQLVFLSPTAPTTAPL